MIDDTETEKPKVGEESAAEQVTRLGEFLVSAIRNGQNTMIVTLEPGGIIRLTTNCGQQPGYDLASSAEQIIRDDLEAAGFTLVKQAVVNSSKSKH